MAFIFSIQKASNLHIDDENLLSDLNRVAKPLTPSLEGNLNEILEVTRNKSIVALGESTHGTKEFNDIKASIIKEMIKFQNLKVIAIESEFSGLESLTKYLMEDPDDLNSEQVVVADSIRSYIKHSGLYGIYRTQEIYSLIKWIKEYNLTKTRAERVALVGIDMQNTSLIISSILKSSYLINKLSSDDLKLFHKMEELFKFVNYPKISKEDLGALLMLLARLKENCKKNLGQSCREIDCQYVKLLEQSLQLRKKKLSFHLYGCYRDKFLAENVLWYFQSLNNGCKMALWSHNGHIAHAKVSKMDRMGLHLRSELQEKYYALAFTFDSGSVRIYDFEGDRKYKEFFYSSTENAKAIEFLFKKIKYENFFLNFKELSQETQHSINNFKYMRVIGATHQTAPKKDYFLQPMAKSFDGVIFQKKTQAAVNLF